jgi:hypothetical protein
MPGPGQGKRSHKKKWRKNTPKLNVNITAINTVMMALSTATPNTMSELLLPNDNTTTAPPATNITANMSATNITDETHVFTATTTASLAPDNDLTTTPTTTLSVAAKHIKSTIKKLCKPSTIATTANVIIEDLWNTLQEYLERGWMTGYGTGRDEG